jgi:uncharacterized membrane protein YwzB
MKLEARYFATIAPALTAVCLLFINLRVPGKQVEERPPAYTLMICAVYIAIAIGLDLFFKKKSQKIARSGLLKDRMQSYFRIQITFFIEYGLLCLSEAYVYFYFDEEIFAGLYCLLLVYISLQKPSIDKMAKRLKLKQGEYQLLKSGENIE